MFKHAGAAEVGVRAGRVGVARKPRATTNGRGYGVHHEMLRKQFAPIVAMGHLPEVRTEDLGR